MREGHGHHPVEAGQRAAAAVRQHVDDEAAEALFVAAQRERPDRAAPRLRVFADDRPDGAEDHLIQVVCGLGSGLDRVREGRVQDRATRARLTWIGRNNPSLFGISGTRAHLNGNMVEANVVL